MSGQRHRQAVLTTAINRRLTRSDGTYVDGLMGDGTPTPSASQTANACAAFYGVVPAHRLRAPRDLVGRLPLDPQGDEESGDLRRCRLTRHDRVHHTSRVILREVTAVEELGQGHIHYAQK